MGILNIFSGSKPGPAKLGQLPKGTFTIDAEGRLLSCTIPQAVPEALVRHIGEQVVATFREAREIRLPFTELIVQYGALKITAKELRGGAMVFLAPKTDPTQPH